MHSSSSLKHDFTGMNNSATLGTTTALVVESSNDNVNPNVIDVTTLITGSGASGDKTIEISSGSPQDDDDDDDDYKSTSQKDQESPKPPDSRWAQMYTTPDWWSLWIGMISFSLATALVFLVPYERGSSRVKYVIPQPMKWHKNPLDAWDIYSGVGTIVLLIFLGGVYMVALKAMGKMENNPISKYAKGFAGISMVATLAFWIGRQQWCLVNGLGYAIWSLVFGMIIGNSPLAAGERLEAIKLVAKDGEFFIKCSLALLAVEFSVLGEVGLPAIAVAWVGSPLALLAAFFIGTRVFKMDVGMSLLIATGATWCGASAISAIGSVIGSSSKDISLSISIIAAGTVLFTFLQPYIAIGAGMDDRVAGAWIGGSVDQTGNVLASAAIISEEATEVAGIVKIVLNSGLGILASVVAFWWQTRQAREGNDRKTKISWLFIWDKFPKFVLGYLLCSALLSIAMAHIEGTAEGDAYQRAVLSLNKWWFAIAFVGIGIGTNFKELWEGAVNSGVIKLYLVANTIDILLALGLAYLFF
jgi:uncharacterized integral membrane protein (TIGR00698 family)